MTMNKFTILPLSLLLPLLAGSGVWGAPHPFLLPSQEDDLVQAKNNAHLMLYPSPEELKIKAEELERAGKWSDLIDLYAAAEETHPDHVIAVGEGRFLGVREYCDQAIARLPAKAIEAYHAKFDARVRESLDEARKTRDADLLARTIARYPFSSVVPRCRLLLASMAVERGDLAEARASLEPLIGPEDPGVAGRAGALLASVLSALGDNDALKELLIKIRAILPDTRVAQGDDVGRLADVVNAALENPPMGKVNGGGGERRSSWPTMAGNPSGTRLMGPSLADPRKTWEAPLQRSISDGLRLDLTNGIPPTSPIVLRSLRPFFPAIHDGILYIHDGYTFSALNLFANQPSKLWEVKSPVALSPNAAVDERTTFAAVWHNGVAYANLFTTTGESEYKLGGILVSVNFPRRALHAVDAWTGKLLWKLGGSADPAARFEDALTLATAPTPDGPYLYVGGVIQPRPTEVFKHYLLCVEAATGRIVWKTFIASGLTEINLFGNSIRDSIGSPVVSDGSTLYYCANLGAAAAVDRATGRLKWVHKYEQLPVRATRTLSVYRNPLEWLNNHPVVVKDLFIVTPTDSKNLYALDAKTGAIRWLVRREPDQRSIVGVCGETLAVGGDAVSLYDLGGGKILARATPSRGAAVGRGAITPGAIEFPTTEGVARMDRRTLKETAWRPWPAPGGGNLTLVDGAMILTTSDRVIVYYDKTVLDNAVREELAKNPNDPAVNFRAALSTLRSGREGDALALLQNVIRLTGGREDGEAKRLNVAAKTQIYNLHFQSGENALFNLKLDEAKEAFRRAADAALDAPSTVAALMKLGEVLTTRGEPADALTVYQALLKDHGDLTLNGEILRNTVRTAVEGLIKQHGRKIYAAEDARAAELYARAAAGKSLDGFFDVGRLYPNSVGAPGALAEAARILEGQGKSTEAAALLRRVLREYPDDAGTVDVHLQLLAILERLGQHGPARAILGALRRKFPDRTVAVEGKTATVRAFVDERLKADHYRLGAMGAALPELHAPLVRKWEIRDNALRDAGLLEYQGTLPEEHRDLILLLSSNTLRALNGDGSSRWSTDLEAVPRFSTIFNDIVIVGSSRMLAAVRLEDGRIAWTWRIPAAAQAFVRMPDAVCVAVMDANVSRVHAVDCAKGVELWSREFSGALYSRLYPADDHLFFYTLVPSGITAFEIESGRKLAANRIEPQEIGSPLFADDRRLLLYVGGETYAMYEVLTGKRLWSSRKTEGFIPKLVAGSETTLAVVETGGTRAQLLTIDAATGKVLRGREDPALASAHALEMEGDAIYLTTRTRPTDRDLTFQAYATSDLKPRWETRLAVGSPAHGIGPGSGVMTKDHYVQFYTIVDNMLRWSGAVVIADKQGKVAQTITSPNNSPRPTVQGITNNGGVIFIIDNVMEYYGK